MSLPEIHAKLAQIRVLATEIDTLADALVGQPPSSDAITYPQNNYVFQKGSTGTTSFTATKTGNGTFRLKNASATIDSATGAFTNIAVGWYTLCLVNNGVESAAIKVGVGRHYLIAGQSNAASYATPPTYQAHAVREGLALISVVPSDGSACVYRDAAFETLDTGILWIHTANALASRNEPHGFTIIAVGSTTVADWSSDAYKQRMAAAITAYKPGAIIWVQGESNPEFVGAANLNDAMWSVVTNSHTAAGYHILWIINICAYPSSGNFAVIAAQDWCKSAQWNTYYGIDMGYQQAGNRGLRGGFRELNEIHFRGSGNADGTDHLLRFGNDMGARLVDLSS